MTTKATVEVWLEELSDTIKWGTQNPLRSNDERIVRLWEALVGFVGEAVLKGHYERFVDSKPGKEPKESLGIAFLRDAYDMQWFSEEHKRRVKNGQDVTDLLDDPRYVFAREVWRRGTVRKQIVCAVRLVINDESASAERPVDPEIRLLLDEVVQVRQSMAVLAGDRKEVPNQKEIRAAETKEPPSPSPSKNEIAILSEMLAVKAFDEGSAISRPEMLNRLRWPTESKRMFDRLKRFGYVVTCNRGQFLTKAGKKQAESYR